MSKNTQLGNLVNGIFVDSTGRVGVGNVSPTVALDVTGAGKFSTTVGVGGTATGTYGTLSVFGGISTKNDNNGKLEIGRYSSGVPNSYIKLGANSDSLRITNNTDAADLVTITNAGNVGIGTSSPSSFAGYNNLSLQASTSGYNLDFFNNSGVRRAAIIYNNAVNFTFSAIESIPMVFETAGVERMRITAAGNVGMGTSNPIVLGGYTCLDIRNTSGAVIEMGDTSGQTTGRYLEIYANVIAGGLTTYGKPMVFTSDSGNFRLTTSGNVLINTSTDNGYKLNLNGQPGANGYTLWTNYSDRRLKENIQPFLNTSILDKINSLNPVTFNYNEASGYDEETRARKVSGFIAQELKEIFPEMVGTLKLNNEEYLDTNLSNLSLYLVKAIQELSAEINILKQK
jgi:hypothetical protein